MACTKAVTLFSLGIIAIAIWRNHLLHAPTTTLVVITANNTTLISHVHSREAK